MKKLIRYSRNYLLSKSVRPYSMRRAFYVAAYTSAIASVATISWALLSWQKNYEHDVRIIFLMSAVFTIYITVWSMNHIEDNQLKLHREEGRLLYLAAIVALIWTTSMVTSLTKEGFGLESEWNAIPLALAFALGIYICFRLVTSFSLPPRVEDTGIEIPWMYYVGIIVVFISSLSAFGFLANSYDLEKYSVLLPMVVPGLAALFLAFGAAKLFKAPPPETRIWDKKPDPVETRHHSRLSGLGSVHVPPKEKISEN